MAAFAADLNELLVEIYRNIEILEESELKKSRLNLSISEMHMIELIAKAGGGMTVSEIAGRLKVTRPLGDGGGQQARAEGLLRKAAARG